MIIAGNDRLGALVGDHRGRGGEACVYNLDLSSEGGACLETWSEVAYVRLYADDSRAERVRELLNCEVAGPRRG